MKRPFVDLGERLIAQKLAAAGQEMNEGWSGELKDEYHHLDNREIVGMSIVQSLIAADYATDEARFKVKAYDYLLGGTGEDLIRAKAWAGRYGEENLENALISWRKLLSDVGEVCDVRSCSAEALRELQSKCLRAAFSLKDKGELPRMGPWLFCYPFKIICIYRKDLWEDSALSDVTMALGIEVIRGITDLIKRGSKFVASIDVSMLDEDEGGFKKGMGTAAIVQGVQKTIAESVESNVLHINSGLYIHGREGIL